MLINKNGLERLEDRLKQDLSYLELPAKPWVRPRYIDDELLLDVAIIGGGMAGLTAAAALKNVGITACIFDKAVKGLEGPWATTARMETLRSPKQLTGPALGIASLTFRAWFEAQFGCQAWDELDKIPRLQWMEYLRWYRQVMAIDVRNEHAVLDVRLDPDNYLELTIKTVKEEKQVRARRLILATGRDGLGGPAIPKFVDSLPADKWAHSSDALDYHQLKDKIVGVVGAGASAMDSAATALEAGASRVDLLIRRETIPTINKGKGAGNPGIVHGFSGLADSWKWRIRHYINTQQVPPPRNSTLRVSRHNNAYFHVGCAVDKVEFEPNTETSTSLLKVHSSKGIFNVDFLLLATGFKIDWHLRPEYAQFAPYVKTWASRFTPPSAEEDAELSACPDLGPHFEFKATAESPLVGIENIYCFSYPAVASHGTVSGDIPAISDGAQLLAKGIAGSLYQEDIAYYYQQLEAFEEPELEGNEWQPAQALPTYVVHEQ